MAVDPTLATADYKAKVESVAKGVLDQQLGWMPTMMTTNISKTAVYNAGVLTVTVSLPAATLSNILPVLKLPGGITVPSLPDTLSAQSSLQF